MQQAVEQKSAITSLDSQIRNYLEFLRLEKNLSPCSVARTIGILLIDEKKFLTMLQNE
jgi:hypothetical protein